MCSYLQVSSAVAVTVLSEILTSAGIPLDEPDDHRLDNGIAPQISKVEEPTKVPMVTIPYESAASVVKKEFKEMENSLNEDSESALPTGRLRCVDVALLRDCLSANKDDQELFNMITKLSLSLMEAQYLQMQLKMLRLKASSFPELLQFYKDPTEMVCRCSEIARQFYDVGVLVHRSEQ